MVLFKSIVGLLLVCSTRMFIVDCVEYDQTLQLGEICLRCVPGSVLDESKKKCNGCNGCKTCDAKDVSYCFSCTDARFLSQGKCLMCAAGCSECKSYDKCDRCIQGLFVDQNSSCQPCSIGCQDCHSLKVCKKCSKGFELLRNMCKIQDHKAPDENTNHKHQPEYPAPPSTFTDTQKALLLVAGVFIFIALLSMSIIVTTYCCCSKTKGSIHEKLVSEINQNISVYTGAGSFLDNEKPRKLNHSEGFQAQTHNPYTLRVQNTGQIRKPVIINSSNPFV